jgi:hypothetical protein
MTFPPAGPTTLLSTIQAYLYVQHNDDDDLQAWWMTQNAFSQGYLDSMNQLNLPIYTNPAIAGALLDWVAQGIYGIARPVLPSGQSVLLGPINTWTPNQIPINYSAVIGTSDFFETNDDIFKRIITWHFFKGDGKVFSIPWLKRRVMRFLVGANGAAPNIDNTYPVGVSIDSSGVAIITLTGTDPTVSQIFQAAVEGGALELPFQFSWSVVIA